MKNYKLVNSKDNRITDKLKCLSIDCSEISCSKTFIFVYGDTMEYDYSSTYESVADFEEITQKDFLALPEPFKVGDYVKVDTGYSGFFFSKIRKILTKHYNERVVYFDGLSGLYDRSSIILTKLTPKQIEVLEL